MAINMDQPDMKNNDLFQIIITIITYSLYQKIYIPKSNFKSKAAILLLFIQLSTKCSLSSILCLVLSK